MKTGYTESELKIYKSEEHVMRIVTADGSKTLKFYLAKVRKTALSEPPRLDFDEFQGYSWLNLVETMKLWTTEFHAWDRFHEMMEWAEARIRERACGLIIFKQTNTNILYLMVQLKKDNNAWSPPMGKLIFMINIF